MKKLFLCFLATGLLVNMSFAQGKKSQDKKAIEPAKFELKTGVDSFSYAAGVSIGQNMKDQGIADLNLEAMFKAFEDVFKGNPTILNKEQANMTLQEKLQEFAKKKGEGEKAKCQQFLENNKKRPGVISLPTGKTPATFIKALKYYKDAWNSGEISKEDYLKRREIELKYSIILT